MGFRYGGVFSKLQSVGLNPLGSSTWVFTIQEYKSLYLVQLSHVISRTNFVTTIVT